MNDTEALSLTREIGTMYTVAVMLPVTVDGGVPAFLQFGSIEEAEAFERTCTANGWFASISPPVKLLVMASPDSVLKFCTETIATAKLQHTPAASESLN